MVWRRSLSRAATLAASSAKVSIDATSETNLRKILTATQRGESASGLSALEQSAKRGREPCCLDRRGRCKRSGPRLGGAERGGRLGHANAGHHVVDDGHR